MVNNVIDEMAIQLMVPCIYYDINIFELFGMYLPPKQLDHSNRLKKCLIAELDARMKSLMESSEISRWKGGCRERAP